MTSIRDFSLENNPFNTTWADSTGSKQLKLWLRAHCQMSVGRIPSDGQRLIDITDIAADIGVADVKHDDSRVLHPCKAYSSPGTRYLQGACRDLDRLYSSLRTAEAAP